MGNVLTEKHALKGNFTNTTVRLAEGLLQGLSDTGYGEDAATRRDKSRRVGGFQHWLGCGGARNVDLTRGRVERGRVEADRGAFGVRSWVAMCSSDDGCGIAIAVLDIDRIEASLAASLLLLLLA